MKLPQPTGEQAQMTLQNITHHLKNLNIIKIKEKKGKTNSQPIQLHTATQ